MRRSTRRARRTPRLVLALASLLPLFSTLSLATTAPASEGESSWLQTLEELAQPLDRAGAAFDSPHRFTAAEKAAVLVALGAATLLSEDLTLVVAGLMVSRGLLAFWPATTACLVGIFLGDLLLVAAGRWLGRAALTRRPLRWWVTPAAVERATRWFRGRGPRVVFASRFLPGSRLPLFLAAGILRAPWRGLAGALLLGALLWTPLLVGLSAATHGAVLSYLRSYERWALPALAAAVVVALVIAHGLLPALTWRGRRLLLGRWHRLTRWEFWPLWLFHAPVLGYALWLGWRHGGLTRFTAANPGIPAGGFVLESKSEILARLPPEVVPRFEQLELPEDLDQRVAAAGRAMARAGLDYPLVGKPDVGERGAGVAILSREVELRDWLRFAPPTVLLQEYVPGEEFGVFYVRHPGGARGRIFSITAKRFPVVVGDGRRTLEELILADPRAVAQAPIHLERHAARLDEIPATGVEIPLVEIGNHCRGTVFLDGREHTTPELERRIDEIARSFEGFYFGRFDLRAPSLAALRAGSGLRVLELNGVTSEATHIYQPGASLLGAYRTLFAQWRLAFAIGAENVRAGARVTPARHLLALLAERRRRSATIPGSRGE